MGWFSSLRSNGQRKSNHHNRHHYEDQEEIIAQFYLSYPKLKCECDDYEDKNYRILAGTSAVQGWRVNQEDAHLCDLDFDPVNHLALFGVFDGHNGPEIARFAAEKLPILLKNNLSYHKKNYEKALEEVFMDLDSSLLNNDINDELIKISRRYEQCYGRIRRRHTSEMIAMATGCTAVVA